MTRIARMHVALALVLGLGGLLVGGSLGHGQGVSAAPAQVQSDTFVGQLSGLDAFIGIGSDGYSVTAYICDGANNAVGDNFQGTVDQASGGVLTLQAANSDTLSLNVDSSTLPGLLVPDGNITGALTTADGNSYPFSTEAAVSPAGLFLADSQTMPDGSVADGGWVVLNDGEVRGSFSAQDTDFGHSGVLGQGLQFARTVTPQLTMTEVPTFGQNLNQVFLGGGGMIRLPITSTFSQPVVFVIVVRRFSGRS